MAINWNRLQSYLLKEGKSLKTKGGAVKIIYANKVIVEKLEYNGYRSSNETTAKVSESKVLEGCFLTMGTPRKVIQNWK